MIARRVSRAVAVLALLASPGAVRGELTPPRRAPPPRVQPPRVQPPTPAPPCTLWVGTIRGNDPHVIATLRLCEDGARVTGELQWTSASSGTNVRAVEGAWSADHGRLVMRDTHLVRQSPVPGWRFCLVTRYDLALASTGHLAGFYDAPACEDHARVELHLQSS